MMTGARRVLSWSSSAGSCKRGREEHSLPCRDVCVLTLVWCLQTRWDTLIAGHVWKCARHRNKGTNKTQICSKVLDLPEEATPALMGKVGGGIAPHLLWCLGGWAQTSDYVAQGPKPGGNIQVGTSDLSHRPHAPKEKLRVQPNTKPQICLKHEGGLVDFFSFVIQLHRLSSMKFADTIFSQC